MSKQHMNLNDRIDILKYVSEGKSIRIIASILDVKPSTISRELFKHRTIKNPNNFNNSKDSKECNSKRLSKAPFVCNGCKNYTYCRKTKYIYNPELANKKYRETLISSRSGNKCNEEYITYLNNLLEPLIKDSGQSIAHVYNSISDDIGISKSTLYRWIDNGYLNIKNIDLPRRIRYPKKNKKNKITPKDTTIKTNRTYKDLLVYKSNNPKANIVEMDSVIGKKGVGEKVILTLLIKRSNFMMAFIRDSNDAQSVLDIFDSIEKKIGRANFSTLFNIVVTDNGSEFSKVNELEMNTRKLQRCHLFYCDPSAPFQKGKIENNHEYLRRYLPKGTSLNNLTQSMLDKVINNINSIKRDSLNGRSPFESLTRSQKNIIKKLGYKEVPPSDIIINPSLFKK